MLRCTFSTKRGVKICFNSGRCLRTPAERDKSPTRAGQHACMLLAAAVTDVLPTTNLNHWSKFSLNPQSLMYKGGLLGLVAADDTADRAAAGVRTCFRNHATAGAARRL